MNNLSKAVKSEMFIFLGRLSGILGVPLLVALMGWQLNKQDSTLESVQQLRNRMGILETKVDYTSADPYHGQDAKRDFALRDEILSVHGNKLDDHESRIKTLEVISAQRH